MALAELLTEEEAKRAVDDFFASFKTEGKLRGKRGRIYVRVSDLTGREETNITIANQIDHCTRYAEMEGITLVGEPVKDLNLSGKDFKKRSIAKMIQEVERGDYEVIIVWKWSRWGRHLRDSMTNMALLEEKNGYLTAATEPADISTPTGNYTRGQFLLMAQLQLEQIREGWRDAHRSRLRNGLPHSGGASFGYEYHPEARSRTEKYTAHPEQFPVLQEMYQNYLTGKSHRAIAVDLNERGITTSKGTKWSNTTVLTLLDQGFGAGRITYGDFEAYSTNWPHAISREDWDQYQIRRAEDAKRNIAGRTKGQKNMFKSMVFCSSCGRRMALQKSVSMSKGKKYRYHTWKCLSRFQSYAVAEACPKATAISDNVLYKKIRAWVETMAKGMDDLPEIMSRKMQVERAKANAEEIRKSIRHYEGLKRGARELRSAGEFTAEEYAQDKALYEQEIDRLKGALRDAERDSNVHALPPQDVFGALLIAMDQGMDPDGLFIAFSKVIGRIEISNGALRSDKVKIVPKWELPPDEGEAGEDAAAAS